MDELKISLSPEAEQNTDEAIQCLIEAASQIFASSEKDFQAMKDTKWYQRLWKLITFSKDNEKKLANGVSNLAKLQEIVMKALLLLAEKSAEISDFVCQNDEEIARLSKNQASLAKTQNSILDELDRLKSGAEKTITLYGIEGDKRKIFMTAFCSVVDSMDCSTSLCQEYYRQVCHALEFSDAQPGIMLSSVDMLTHRESLLLYRVIMEYVFLGTDCFECEAEILKYLAISPKNSETTKAFIAKQVTRGGKEILLTNHNENEYAFIEDDEIDWDFDDEYSYKAEDAQEDDTYPETESATEEAWKPSSQELIEQIQTCIFDIFPDENTDKKKSTNPKRCTDFLLKHAPTVQKKTIVAYAEGFMGSSKFLFTTSALYFYGGMFTKLQRIKYSDVDATKCSFVASKGGFFSRCGYIKITLKSLSEPIEVSEADVHNACKLMNLLCLLSAIDSDTPDTATSIIDSTDEIKLSHARALTLFAAKYSLSIIDSVRIAYDLMMSSDKNDSYFGFYRSLSFVSADKVSDMLEAEITNYMSMLPYPSEDVLITQLFHNAISLIQFSTGKCREQTAEQIKALEMLANSLGLSKENVDCEIPIAQLTYRIIRNDVTSKDYAALAPIAVGSALGAIFTASLLGPVALGLTAAVTLLNNSGEQKKVRKAVISKVANSYARLYQYLLSLGNEWKNDLFLLEKSAELNQIPITVLVKKE